MTLRFRCSGGGVASVSPGSATGDDVCGGVVIRSAPFTPSTAVADDACGSGGGPDVTISNPPPGDFPLGTTRLDYSTTDGAGLTASCDTSVTVVDTTPPAIARAAASPDALWPPDHRMVAVSVAMTASDACDSAAPACAISEITSNQPIDGDGDGDTSPDWEITGPLTANVRAERSSRQRGAGADPQAQPGRVYTLRVTCTDGAGQVTSAITAVTVPDRSPSQEDRRQERGRSGSR